MPLTDDAYKGLTDTDKKIISILGTDYNMGTNITEPLPESDVSITENVYFILFVGYKH